MHARCLLLPKLSHALYLVLGFVSNLFVYLLTRVMHVCHTIYFLKVSRRLGLVYGGGNIGLMGLVSQAVHRGGGHVLGYMHSLTD